MLGKPGIRGLNMLHVCERPHLTCTGRPAAARRSAALRGAVQTDGSSVRRLQRSAFCRKDHANVTPPCLYCHLQECTESAHVRGAGPLTTFKVTGICRKLSFVQKEHENFCKMTVSVWQRPHFTTYLVKKSSLRREQSVFCVPI